VTTIAQVTRRHIEDYNPWLAARPGQNKPRLTPGTIIHRLGTLRMFFIRLDESGWEEALCASVGHTAPRLCGPSRCPMRAGPSRLHVQ
jgi:hypothetical protein